MLFRSTAEDVKAADGEVVEHDGRAEDARAWESGVKQQDMRDKHAAVPVTTSKFASLKRKLFPSQNRRHPRHVPPLMTSPISAPLKASLPPVRESSHRSMSRTYVKGVCEQNQTIDCSSKSICMEKLELKQPKGDGLEDAPESDASATEVDNNWRPSGRRTLIDDDDDRHLESAVEALDLESSIADQTLEEVSLRTDSLAHLP
ncbi:unnamed protein product [Phytophthora fragariaefolia]|uniref:Unnamed protein product n=1 Tax=Phytophthora fragariaefolia TaxID=1490495 RepID=A0A9W6XJT3_9STRA|nr:unnamed protein product [Phytophthora fragariaefolia]